MALQCATRPRSSLPPVHTPLTTRKHDPTKLSHNRHRTRRSRRVRTPLIRDVGADPDEAHGVGASVGSPRWWAAPTAEGRRLVVPIVGPPTQAVFIDTLAAPPPPSTVISFPRTHPTTSRTPSTRGRSGGPRRRPRALRKLPDDGAGRQRCGAPAGTRSPSTGRENQIESPRSAHSPDQRPGKTCHPTQNSLSSTSRSVVQVWPHSSWSPTLVAPRPRRRSTSASRLSPADRSRWTRFFTVLPSGTLRQSRIPGHPSDPRPRPLTPVVWGSGPGVSPAA